MFLKPSLYMTCVFIFTVVLLLPGCLDSNESQLSLSGLVYCSEGAPDNFNPHTGTSFTNFNASSRVIFNRLVKTDNVTGRILPSLALRWSVSDDGKSYVFDLREDVVFHTTDWFKPSRAFNADDVIFSFERQRDFNHPFHDNGNTDYNYYQSSGFQNNIQSISKTSDTQVQFQLHKPDSSFLFSLSMDFSSILSKEYAEKLQEQGLIAQFDQQPIGTGPFQFKKYQNDAFIRYSAHPHFMDGKSKIDHLVYAITPDSSTRYARLVSGECDVMANPPKSQYDLLKNNPDIQVYQKPGLNIGYLAFNTLKAPLDNLKVRQAIAMAIDKKRLVERVYGDLGTINHSLLPPAMAPYYNNNLKGQEFNPEKAKAILEEQNVLPISIDLWALPVQRAYNPNGMLMAELIQEDLSQIGINIRLVTFEWSTYLEKVKAGEHDMALLGWVADNYSANDFLSTLIGCDGITTRTNRTRWCSRQLDSYLQEANESTDESKKTQLYYLVQSIIADQVPLIPIATGESVLVVDKQVQNIELQTLGGIKFTDIRKAPK